MSLETDVATIYSTYPRKIGRRKALLEIERALRRLQTGEFGPKLTSEEAADGLLKATALYARSPAGQREQFTPHPSTWFHQSRYLDNPKEWFTDDNPKTFTQQSVSGTQRAAEEFLNKKRSSSGIPQEPGAALSIPPRIDSSRFRAVGQDSLPLLRSGD